MDRLIASALLISVLVVSCDSGNSTVPSSSTNQLVSINFGEVVSLNPNFRVGFKSLLSESRCPRNAACLWVGIANIQLLLLRPTADSIFVPLFIYGGVTQADTNRHISKDTLGLRLTLLQLDPYPEVDSVYAPSKYRALLRVSPQ